MIAYNPTALKNLHLTKEAKGWIKKKILTAEQFENIAASYPCQFYHPNIIIRILIFLASVIGISGITGLLALIIKDTSEESIFGLMIIYGLISWVVLDVFFIKTNHHYKSGLTEALLYHSMLFVIIGIVALADFDERTILLVSFLVISIGAIRYLDLISTITSLCLGTYLLFDLFFNMGEVFQFLIPFVFLAVFTPLYFLVHAIRGKHTAYLWSDVLLIVEMFSLLMIYLAGNYFIVRELTVSMLYLDLSDGQDIPYAMVFYALTVIVPLIYLYFGIKNKDRVLLGVSLLVLAFSVFTFKYYFSLGHPEISLTLAGMVLFGGTLALQNYLKITRNGFTRENLLDEKWGNANVEAFIISQTLGGNKAVADTTETGGGGEFGGGGSSDSF